jgi:hypothetical protein
METLLRSGPEADKRIVRAIRLNIATQFQRTDEQRDEDERIRKAFPDAGGTMRIPPAGISDIDVDQIKANLSRLQSAGEIARFGQREAQ